MQSDRTNEKQQGSGTDDDARLKGSLKRVRLAEIFHILQKSLKTGILIVKYALITKKVFIYNGDVIFAASNVKDERLGEFLVDEGRITPEEHLKADEIFREKKGRLGKILVELGYLTPQEVLKSVQRQVEEILLSLFSFVDGEYEFQEGSLPSDELIKLRISTANIIYRGIKRNDDRQFIHRVIPPLDTVLNFSQDPRSVFQHVTIDDADKEILSFVNGKNSIRDLMLKSPLDDFETLKTLYAFLSTEIIEVIRETESPVVHHASEAVTEPEIVLSKEYIDRIEEMFGRLEHLGYYELLGVRRDASFGEIKKSAYKVLKEFHPDRRFSLPTDNFSIKKKLTTIQSHIIKAYQTLYDPVRRKEYDRLYMAATAERTKKIAVVAIAVVVVTSIIFVTLSIMKNRPVLTDVAVIEQSEGIKVQGSRPGPLPAVSDPGSYSVNIQPRTAYQGTVFRLVPVNLDLTDAEIQWITDEENVHYGKGARFLPKDIRKGSTVQARVTRGDEVILSNIAVIKNSPPYISSARIMREDRKPGVLFAEAMGNDPDGDEFTVAYEWTRNGEPAGDGKYLESPIKRGDNVSVKITLYDDEDYSEHIILRRDVVNMPPLIVEDNTFDFDTKVYTHMVVADDPDGDTLTFSLKSAPEGIEIDPQTGLIKWSVPQDFTGNVPITVSVADGNGGEITREIEFIINNVPKEE
jgi:curved DNA-binding protein CbpA